MQLVKTDKSLYQERHFLLKQKSCHEFWVPDKTISGYCHLRSSFFPPPNHINSSHWQNKDQSRNQTKLHRGWKPLSRVTGYTEFSETLMKEKESHKPPLLRYLPVSGKKEMCLANS